MTRTPGTARAADEGYAPSLAAKVPGSLQGRNLAIELRGWIRDPSAPRISAHRCERQACRTRVEDVADAFEDPYVVNVLAPAAHDPTLRLLRVHPAEGRESPKLAGVERVEIAS